MKVRKEESQNGTGDSDKDIRKGKTMEREAEKVKKITGNKEETKQKAKQDKERKR